MAFDLKKLVKQVAAASADNRSGYIRPGEGTLKIKSVLIKEGHKGTNFITEFEVVSAKQTDPAIAPNVVGSTVAIVLPLIGERTQSSMNSIRGLVEAATNSKGEECSEEVISGFCDPKNSDTVAGTLVKFQAVQVKTKKGGDFTRVSFSPAE